MAHVQLNILGPVEVLVDGESQPLPTSARARLLVGLLGIKQTYSQADLAHAFWVDAYALDPALLHDRLSHVISAARPVFGDSRALRSRSRIVELDPANIERWSFSTDSDEFFELAESESRDDLRAALRLIRGRPLSGLAIPFDTEIEWLDDYVAAVTDTLQTVLTTLGFHASSVDQQVRDLFEGRVSLVLRRLDRLKSAPPMQQTHLAEGHVGQVVQVLEAIYPDAPALVDLARMVVTGKPHARDAEVTLVLADGSAAERYWLTLLTRMQLATSTFYLAVTSRATLSSNIASTCTEVAEVFACSNEEDAEREAQRFLESSTALTVVVPKAQGGPRRQPVVFARADPTTSVRVLSGVGHVEASDVILLEAQLPRNDCVVELRLRSEMLRTDHYCYWLSDRPVYLKRITIDASGLSLPAGQRLRLRPCVASAAYEVTENEGLFHLELEAWLVRGQGVVLTWG